MTTVQVAKLRGIFERNRDRVFIVDSLKNKEYTYKDIEDSSLRVASLLRKSKIQKGDKVSIILPNCIEFIVLYFACMEIGAIPIPINIKLHQKEKEYILQNSGAKMLFMDSSMKEELTSLSHLDVFYTDKKNLLELAQNEVPYSKRSFEDIQDDDTIIIIYTSGTTARPKGVMITYGNIIRNGSMFVALLGMTSDLRFYGWLAHAYLGGFYNLMLIPFLAEGSILLDEAFNPNVALTLWNKIKKYSVTALWLVPSIMSIILSIDRSTKKFTKKDHTIKLALVGTAPLPVTLKRRFEDRYAMALYENYGLSETFFISTNSPGFPLNKGVGKIVPECEVFILDDDGKPCPKGVPGEIVVKTKYLMQGYYKNAEETKKSVRDGKFYTGDVGYVDADGYLFITDRKKDIIIRGGINISPKEVEEAILSHPKVDEVAVIGVPNQLTGEDVFAVVKAKPGVHEDDLKEVCKQSLASFKIPNKFIFVEEFPRSVTGKIQKAVLKEMLQGGKL